MELDVIDKRILSVLLQHSRWPASTIAKECKTTREIVQYRMRKLEQQGIIKGYIAKIDMSLFCAGVATLVCKLQRNEQQYKAFITMLQQHVAVNWCAELAGSADIVITLLYKNAENLAKTVAEINHALGTMLREQELALFITEYKFDRQGIITGKAQQTGRTLRFQGTAADIDDTDRGILSALALNCRQTNVELAKQLTISEDTVRLRIKQLEERSIIFSYSIILDVASCGYESYYVRLQMEQLTEQTIHKISYYVQQNPFIGHCARTAGTHNIVLSLYSKDRKHFHELLLDLRKTFGNLITKEEFQLNLKEYKEVFLPKGFLEAH